MQRWREALRPRTGRRSGWGRGSIAGAIISLALGFSAGCREQNPAPSAGLGQVRLLESQALGAMVVKTKEREIGTGGSLSISVAAVSGLSAAAVDPWVAAFGQVLDFRSLRPADRVRVELSGHGALHRVEVYKSAIERYEALAGEDGRPVARAIALAPEPRFRRVSGTVRSNLYDALLAAGGTTELVSQMADLFACKVDFLVDPRPGDRFDILVEEQWMGGEPIGQDILMARYDGRRASHAAYRYTNRKGERDYYAANGASLRTSFLRSPLKYRRISSQFSQRRLHPIHKIYKTHYGVDFAAPRGTPVSAVGDGVVEFAGYKGANGNLVILRHPGGLESYYLHLQHIAEPVHRGARIAQGQVIGRVGSTGDATGAHLCFRVRKRGKFVDPLRLDLPAGPPVPVAELEAFAAERRKWEGLTYVLAGGTAVPARDLARLAGHAGQVAQASAVARYAVDAVPLGGEDLGRVEAQPETDPGTKVEARGTL
ncbi:MAG TPA: M23 family metallopeptidase [Candidatus Udaeobacter sp.]|nr:M23 family metallopeptidase [Candidatus Udaeobacter sp.]